jgi:hypothetical protein
MQVSMIHKEPENHLLQCSNTPFAASVKLAMTSKNILESFGEEGCDMSRYSVYDNFFQQAAVHMSHLSYRVLTMIGSTGKIVRRIEDYCGGVDTPSTDRSTHTAHSLHSKQQASFSCPSSLLVIRSDVRQKSSSSPRAGCCCCSPRPDPFHIISSTPCFSYTSCEHRQYGSTPPVVRDRKDRKSVPGACCNSPPVALWSYCAQA